MGDAVNQEVIGVGSLHHSRKAGHNAAQQQGLGGGLAAFVQGVDQGTPPCRVPPQAYEGGSE